MIKMIGRNGLWIFLLCAFSILVNWPIFHFHSMYNEQPIIYLANHSIHGFKDFFQVYLHPRMLEMDIPFFRPSGHFLLYQLLTPLFGWDNQNALLAVNLIFLGVIGFLLIQLYTEFFPGLFVGGLVAFSFYLMNPALILGRVTLMHFEYAYVMFVLAGLYSLVIFCKKNLTAVPLPITNLHFQHLRFYVGFLIFFITATTFKESSLLLGPVAMCYLLITLYDGQSGFIVKVLKNKEIIYILLIPFLLTILLTFYLTQSWGGGYSHPLHALAPQNFNSIQEFLRFMLSLSGEPYTQDDLLKGSRIFRQVQTPLSVHLMVWMLLAATAFSVLKVFSQPGLVFKKSIVFLFLSLLLFMLLPLGWGMGYPWHLSLSLVCESLLLGFGLEYAGRTFLARRRFISLVIILFALALGMATYHVDVSNINFIAQSAKGQSWRLTYNAVMHPPALKNKLNKDSIIIVEDTQNIGDYELGDSTYPLMLFAANNFDQVNLSNFMHQDKVFVHIDPTYDSTLFRWAYHRPDLKEQMISFKPFPLPTISDRLLLSWLRHLENINAVAYDKNGNWFDDTASFKTNILREQERRHLEFSRYTSIKETALSANAVLAKNLPYPDPELCQSTCDIDHGCKGFTYIHAMGGKYFLARCFFYNKIAAAGKPCKICTGFVKTV